MLVFLGLLSRDGSQMDFPTKPTIHIPFYDPGFCFRENKNETPLNGFTVILNPFDDAGVASHLTLIRGKILELVHKENLNTVRITLEMPQFPLAGLRGAREPIVAPALAWPPSSGWTTR